MINNIWFNKPTIGWREKWEVLKVLNSGWISTGKKVKQLESEFLQYLKLDSIQCAVATNSCTAAMHVALMLEGIGPGDEVIVPAVTFPATANVVEHVGAKVVFCDVEPNTLNIDIYDAHKKITDKTKAIIPVNLYGQACDLEGLQDFGSRDIKIIQDNAHAVETRHKGYSLPYYSDYSCYSFYATKNMTTAEGGMLIVDTEEKRQRAEMLCLHGLSKDAWKRYQATGYQLWDLEFPGYKYNMTDIAAAMGIWQLRRLNENWERRSAIVEKYREGLDSVLGVRLIDDKSRVKINSRRYGLWIPGETNAYHLFPIIFDEDENNKIKDKSQEQIIREIESYGVGVGVHFPCLPLTKYYREKYGYRKDDFPVASKKTEKIVSIPLYPGLIDNQVQRIINAVKCVCR